ncbi:MAG: hypothetical protein EAZ33_00275 [Oscillatoriales cyanobacterium]|nr:MAG: hypothetical protein EAZ33_00275 [Oscillatoriales cyanobacterium]
MSECYFIDQDFHRWYPPRDLSVESIPNRKSKILSSPEFIRGVNLKCWLNIWAAIVSAMHSPKPDRMLSFFASTKAMTGDSMTSCSGDLLIRKSQ